MSVREGYKQTEIGVIPEEWEVASLDRVVQSMHQGINTVTEKINYEDNGIDILQAKHITSGFIDFSDPRKVSEETYKKYLAKYQPQIDHILLTNIGTIGKVLLVKSDMKFLIAWNLFLIKADSSLVDPRFLFSIFQRLDSEKYYDKFLTGNATKFINKKFLSDMVIPLPPLPEQQKIAEILSTVDQKIDSIDSKIEETQTLKRGLMQRLLSEGIGHSEFKESEVGRIPTGWEVLQLDQISKITDSLHITPKFVEEGFAMVRVADIKTGMLNLSGTLKVSEETYAMFTKSYRPKKGDIVLSRVGSYGISSFVTTDEPFCMGQNTVVIEPKIDNRFLYLFLNSTNITKQIEDGSYGSGYKSLSLKHIKQLKIAIPLEEEQKQIAEILSTTDEKLESLRAKKEAFETLKKGLMQKLLSGEVRV